MVACALVDADKRVLIAQRPQGKALAGLWEFPGGKLERGERPEQTLIRELHEEIGITVKEDCLAPLTFASHAYDDFHLLMPLYICRRWDGEVIAREGQQLAWVRANKLRDYHDAAGGHSADPASDRFADVRGLLFRRTANTSSPGFDRAIQYAAGLCIERESSLEYSGRPGHAGR